MIYDKIVFDVVKNNYMRIVLDYTFRYHSSILFQLEN
jgi:hypothetical protein